MRLIETELNSFRILINFSKINLTNTLAFDRCPLLPVMDFPIDLLNGLSAVKRWRVLWVLTTSCSSPTTDTTR